MRILIAEVQDWERELFAAAFRDHDLQLVEAALDERIETDIGAVEIVSTFVSPPSPTSSSRACQNSG
jgi:hypothetical protein